jgi:D-sedoheptulose 7-phosphate isomerase
MEKIVFTNGCFDILHAGHVDLLTRAKSLGTRLIVGINSDESVRKIKGAPRPFISQNERAVVLLGLKAVDEVRIFDETTPARLIAEIQPDVLVKGGDWQPNEIVGADVVRAKGGEVFSLPLKENFSSSAIVQRILQSAEKTLPTAKNGIVKNALAAHEELFKLLANEIEIIEHCAEIIFAALERGNKILICGNGGSAADAQHIAAEFTGRYERERRGLPAIALTTDTSALTAIGNDYGFERIFARQTEALAVADDVLIGISTSGNSPNVLAAIMTAREIGCQIIGLTGANGKKLASVCDAAVIVPATRTARIQEAHGFIGHVWCEIVDAKMAKP